MPEEEKKPEVSPYFQEFKSKLVNKLPTSTTQVSGGPIVPYKIAKRLLDVFTETHKNEECPGCEQLYVQSMVTAFETVGLPPFIVQQILDEWMKQIRDNPPDFLKKEE